jgi:predicted ribosome quality control (RQC) complex YloA/Tae2 family protein
MEQGQLLLAYQYALKPGESRLEIPELEMTIPLDPTLSATDNAERLFRRYRKLRDAHSKIPPLIEEAEAEAARLADLEAFARLAESEADLRAVRRDLAGPPEEPAGKKPKADKRRGPARMALDGYTALVGRSARENEEVTFRLARRDDLWLHARERTGAHVILQGGGPDPPAGMVEAAAALAAYYSEGRSDSYVDVDVTPVRNVRKIPGGPAGRVTYHHFRTVRVKPSNEEWQQSGK